MALAEAIALRDAAEAALRTTQARLRAELERLRRELAELDSELIAAAWRELRRLELLELKQAAELAETEREVERRQADYLAARRDRRSLERLREQRRREHLARLEWYEQTENDERAVISYSRKGSEP